MSDDEAQVTNWDRREPLARLPELTEEELGIVAQALVDYAAKVEVALAIPALVAVARHEHVVVMSLLTAVQEALSSLR